VAQSIELVLVDVATLGSFHTMASVQYAPFQLRCRSFNRLVVIVAEHFHCWLNVCLAHIDARVPDFLKTPLDDRFAVLHPIMQLQSSSEIVPVAPSPPNLNQW
jgi:hypothetical protein